MNDSCVFFVCERKIVGFGWSINLSVRRKTLFFLCLILLEQFLTLYGYVKNTWMTLENSPTTKKHHHQHPSDTFMDSRGFQTFVLGTWVEPCDGRKTFLSRNNWKVGWWNFLEKKWSLKTGDIPSFSGRMISSEESFIILFEEILHQLIWIFVQIFSNIQKVVCGRISEPSNSMVLKNAFFAGNWKDFDSDIIRRHRVQWSPIDFPSFFNKRIVRSGEM